MTCLPSLPEAATLRGRAQGGDHLPCHVLRDHGVLTANAAGAPVIFLYAPALDDGSAFLPHTSGGLLCLAPVVGRPGYYRDAASGSVWDSSGAAVQGPSRGAVLPRLPAFNVMWFVWYAFFPGTGVLG